MKFQKQFNVPDTGFDALVKFIHCVFQHYNIKDADRLPTSIFTAKSSLSFSTKYWKYTMCPECYTLYNPTELKDYKEDGQLSVMKCDHVEFPYHRSERKRLPCGQSLTQKINTRKGPLLHPLSIYPVGSIKQQLYMMYQWPDFEEMLCHSSR
jgi:DNA modification methylase